MKKLMFAIAGAASFAALAADPAPGANDISIVGFENYTADAGVVGTGDDGQPGNTLWTCAGEDASLVKTYGGDNAAAPTIKEPAPFDGASENAKYLALDTNGSELQRAVGTTVAATGTYIDTLVQFTPSESAPTSTDLDGAKLAIWLGVDSENNTTNLYVQGCLWDENFQPAPKTYVLAPASGTKVIDPGSWYRLTVKAIPNVLSDDSTMQISAFQIVVDGTEMVTTESVFTAGLQAALEQSGSGMFASADIQAALSANKIVPSIQSAMGAAGTPVTLTSVGFKGTGAIDDFVVTTAQPDFTPAAIDFILTWPTTLTSVSYTLDGEAGEALTIANGTVTIHGTNGAPVTLTGSLGYATKTVTGAVAANGTLALTAGIDLYFPLTATAGQDGSAEHPFEVADATGIKSLAAAVAALADARGLSFVQTANIDMASAGPFAGVGTYDATPTGGTPFTGTYDGQGFKIANVTMTARNYGGIFNQVNGGTIRNLTVENISVVSGATGEYGFAIIGNAGNGATLQNLVAAGSFLSSETPATHNAAGIAVRLSAGGIGTLVKDCTNNAAIYGNYTKLAGICAITQLKIGGNAVTFDGCANNGALNLSRTTTGVTGLAGIVGYVSDTNVLVNCSNTGSINNTATGANTDCNGQLIGTAHNQALTDNGGNSAPANAKMVGKYNTATVTGFQYATVDNGVATTVTTLAKDTTYLLEGNVAASETPVFTLAAEGDTIAFDAALGYTFAGTIAAGEGLQASAETVGTVTTYTAAAAGGDDYKVVIGESDVVITPTAEDFATIEQYLPEGVETNDVEAVNALLAQDIGTTGVKVWQAAFLGLAPTAEGLDAFKIDSITIGADGKVTVEMADGVTPKTGRGVDITLKLMASDDLAFTNPTAVATATAASNFEFSAVTPASGETKKFYKVVVEFAGSQN